MSTCIKHSECCQDLVLKTAKVGKYKGELFFGCTQYPSCSNIVSLHFFRDEMSDIEKEIERIFFPFVRSNYFIYATFGFLYFNLKNVGLLDYLLLTKGIIDRNEDVEQGLTGALIYHSLFYHLYLIPSPDIRLYLTNNFPNTFSKLYVIPLQDRLEGIDYINHKVDESKFAEYRNYRT